jgi:hypothetical protein
MTTAQLPLTGLELKEQGIASLERYRWVDRARKVAEEFCRDFGWTSTDSLHHVMGEPPHPNCWGAVFHDSRFASAGRKRSTRPEAHGRWIEIWRLR